MSAKIKLSDSDIHPHLRARMVQRGVTRNEITVYYKLVAEKTMILTVKARYGECFEEVSR